MPENTARVLTTSLQHANEYKEITSKTNSLNADDAAEEQKKPEFREVGGKLPSALASICARQA
jgi:hypothetical protein